MFECHTCHTLIITIKWTSESKDGSRSGRMYCQCGVVMRIELTTLHDSHLSAEEIKAVQERHREHLETYDEKGTKTPWPPVPRPSQFGT